MKGKCWKFGDDINTDEIIPAIYLDVIDDKEMATHCMEGIDEQFTRKAQPGDIIVGGKNFGCGSSREHAPLAVRAFGIQCVVAESFARIFFRNAINIGLPIAECPEAAREADEGDVLKVDFEAGIVTNVSKGAQHAFAPFPDHIRSIIEAGGLMAWVKQTVQG